MSPFEFQPPKEQPVVELQRIYQKILGTSVSPENIQTFFDTTLNELVVLIEKAVAEYKKSNSVIPLVEAEVENRALKAMSIPDVTETLQAVSEREQAMIQLRHLIASQTEIRAAVIVPPKKGANSIVPGSGAGIEQKKLIPRLLTLLYILENDLGYGLSQEETPVHITEGATTDEMMRQHPYYRVLIESLNRVVYLCEEEGNASYIFDTEVLSVPLEQLDARNKNAFNDLIKATPEVGRRLIQGPLWRKKMVAYLTEEFSLDVKDENEEVKQPIVSIPQSDFVPRVEVPRKKEGWESASGLRSIVSSSNNFIAESAEQFRTEHPEWFEVQRSNGNGREVEHYHPDLVKKIIERFASIPQKKDGWENTNSLRGRLHSDHSSIRTFVEQFRAEHPEWFNIQRAKKGPQSEHYHPDLVKKIIERFASIPQKKDGWESANSLKDTVYSGAVTIRSFVEQFREERPEWFEKQITQGKETEHYHPELVKKIQEYFASVPQKKEGWESAVRLGRKIHSDPDTIKLLVEQFRAEYPEWFEIQKTGSREVEHYHPDLVKKITEYFTATPWEKDGWEGASSLSRITHSNSVIIKSYAEQFRTEHPEWFEVQRTRGRESENYHPDLVKKIIERFMSVPKKKEGWRSANSLSNEMHSKHYTVKKFVEQFRTEHPEWFEVQKFGRSTQSESYHPDLVQKIKEHFPSKFDK